MDSKKHNCCALCYFARIRRDGICGVYCTGGFENKDGTCPLYICCDDRKAIDAFKRQSLTV